MAHPIIFNSSLGLGIMLTSLGINATLRPENHLRSLGFPVPSDPQAKTFSHALMRIWGVRNISVGLLVALLWTTGDERLLGKGLCAALSLPITDGFVSRLVIGGGELQHWAFPPVLLVMIAGLFGWF